jgi:hypothetical protein
MPTPHPITISVMPFCAACGIPIAGEEKSCPSCGRQQDPGSAGKEMSGPGEAGITWTGKAPLVTNPEVLRGYALLFVIMVVLGAAISLMTGNLEVLVYLFIPVTVGIIILLVLVSLVMQLMTAGGLEIQGIVDAGGVSHQVGATSRRIHRGGIILGVLAALGGVRGGLVTTGGSLIAFSQENNSIPWNEIRSVKVYPRDRLIVVRNESKMNPVALYCTEGNYKHVLGIIRTRVPAATRFS